MNAWPTPPPPPPPPLLPQQQEQQQPQRQQQEPPPPPPPPPLPPPPPSPPPPRQQHQQYTSGRVSSMTSRLGQKAVSVAAGVSLVALLVLLWTVVVVKRLPAPYPSPPDARTPAAAITTAPAFKETHLPGGLKPTDNGEEIFSDTTTVPTETPTAIHVPERSHPPHTLRKEGSGNMPCDAKREDVRVEYVTPLKISTLSYHKDDLRYSDDWSSTPEWPKTSDIDPMNAASTSIDSGHFRHRQAQLWDPHPQYTFCAFGHFFHLILAEDSSFVSPRLRVTHLWHNYTQRESPPVRTEKCFYTGSVSGDPKSSVAVNLCHGMRGHIHTSSGNFLIQPVEPWLQHNKSMIHKVSMVNPRNTYSNTSSSLHCGLEGNETRKIKNDGLQDLHRAKRGLRMSSPSRRKLMSQREYFVEVMVVADKKMAEYHGDDLKDYILTLMSIVAKLYKDSSIGNPISVAVVKLMVLRDQEFISRPHKYSGRGKHMIGTSASKMRLHFCGWQRQYHIYHDDHHDTALLLTRENICRDPSEHKCETVGLAERGSMCDMNASCAIVQDNGFSAAFSIAHEFGHMLNMPHDDAEECKAFTDSDASLNVMSRMLGTSPWSWSKCSRHFVTEFLEAGHGGCLLDSPSEEISIPGKELPGENFPADRQCQLQFGQGYRLCSYMPVCQQLWCSLGGEEEGGCITKHVPWADGTSCGTGKWCQRGSCVVRDPQALIPLDGGWGSWDKFGECSRTCGGGVKRATRECNNPPPANGGRYCVGRRLKFQSCNTKNCPKNSKDFREVQCAAFNNNTFGLKEFPPDVKWVPKYGINPEHRCQLNCRVANTPTHFPLRDKVVDGTPCGPDTFDICVNGQCRPAGCDHYLGSKAKLDICGTCNGDNSSCHLVTGTFNKTVSNTGYNEVVRIPIGSINVDIQQFGYQGDSNDGNYLALKDDSNEYIINGNYVLNTYHKIISLNGTKIEYTGINSSIERINATKPLKQDLIIQILSVGKLYPPQITYKYVIRCLWKYSQWSECTKQCLGVSYRMPYCSLLDRNEEIAEHYCSKMPKPKVMEKPCNSQCNISWQLTATECSVQCGRGYRNLTAHCIVEIAPNEVQHIDSHLCIQHLETPPEYEECEVPCGHWKFGDWGSCSKTCGGGYQHRLVECVGNMGEPVNESLCNAHQRVTMQKCAISSCPSWKLGDWTPCSVTCGTGERRRPYWCNQDNRIVSPQFCNSQLPPPHRERCSRACSASWQQM